MRTGIHSHVRLIAAVVVTAILSIGCKTAPPERAEVSDLDKITAKVTAIDLEHRLVTLMGPEGNEVTVEVSDAVRNLPQVRVGDDVTVSYYRGLAAEVTDAAPGDETGTVDVAAGRAPAGARPGGVAGASVAAIVTIESVDKKRNTVSFRGADGLVRVIDVKRPEMQKFIAGLKPGDKVRVTYTEAVAVSVLPAS
jgi:hypothetical protein